jgi:hypothetical protein
MDNIQNTYNDRSILSFVKGTNNIILTPKLAPIKLKPNKTSSNNLLELNIDIPTIELTETIVSVTPNTSNNNEHVVFDFMTQQKSIAISQYRLALKWYGVYLLYGLIGGVFINLISRSPVMIFDMIFNIMLSPIIYYNSPRKILIRIDKNQFIFYYTIPFICGLFFRFLDMITILSQFSLNFDNVRSTIQIVLTTLVCIIILVMIMYYIYISSEPIINFLLFIIFSLIISITCYYYYNDNGNIHIHHYFVGLIIMLLSKNTKYKLVIMIHGIGYAVYIEGISKWGYAPIFWK